MGSQTNFRMERTKAKLYGYDGTNILVKGKIKVMREFQDAKQKSEFYVAKTDSKTVLSLQTWRVLGMIQILNEITSKEDKKKKKTMEYQWKKQMLRRKLR